MQFCLTVPSSSPFGKLDNFTLINRFRNFLLNILSIFLLKLRAMAGGLFMGGTLINLILTAAINRGAELTFPFYQQFRVTAEARRSAKHFWDLCAGIILIHHCLRWNCGEFPLQLKMFCLVWLLLSSARQTWIVKCALLGVCKIDHMSRVLQLDWSEPMHRSDSPICTPRAPSTVRTLIHLRLFGLSHLGSKNRHCDFRNEL